ncbi:MAG: hypothetical protein U0930_15120 [Pirellulales bacterium]
MQTTRQSDSNEGMQGFGLLLFVLRIWATSVEVFLHRDMGSRYLGFNAVGVFFLVPIYWSFKWPHHNVEPMLLFLLAYLAMVLVTRASVLRRAVSGEICHSFYNGFPRLLAQNATEREEAVAKRYAEPITLIGFGYLTATLCEPLGWYVMIAGVSMLVLGILSNLSTQMQVTNLRDAMIEQRYMAEQFRKRW